MNKEELFAAVGKKTGTNRDTSKLFVNAILDVVTESLAAGEDVKLVGFGTFSVSTRPARSGRNPKTGQVLQLPAKKVPKFTTGAVLKAAVEANDDNRI